MKQDKEKDLKIFIHKINNLYSTKMIRYVVVDSQNCLDQSYGLVSIFNVSKKKKPQTQT